MAVFADNHGAQGIRRLIYVSDSDISARDTQREVASLVKQARSRNNSQGISGALLFSGAHFAQLLEGSDSDVRDVMSSILADPRHRNIRIVFDENIPVRCLLDWGLGYAGPSRYVEKAIRRAAIDAERGDRRGAENLRRLIVEFASG